MSGDRLRLARPLQQEELREDGNALQVDRESPKDLGRGELVRSDERQQETGSDDELDAERVDRWVIRRPIFDAHEVDDVAAGRNKEGRIASKGDLSGDGERLGETRRRFE